MAFSQVGSGTLFISSTNPLTPSWNANQPRNAGDLLVCIAGADNSNPTPAGLGFPADWTVAGTIAAGGNQYAAVAYKVATGGDDPPQITVTGISEAFVHLSEWTGESSPVVDVATTGSWVSTTSYPLTGSAPTAANELKFAAWMWNKGGKAGTVSWTLSGVTSLGANTQSDRDQFVCGYQLNPPTGSAATATATASTAGSSMAGVLVTFKPGGPPPTNLAIQNATQSQSVASPALTQTHHLAVQSAAQAQSVPQMSLAQVHQLVVASAAQAQAAGTVSLSQQAQLAIANAAQAQSAGALSLTQVHNLVVQNAAQSQAAPNVGITKQSTLAIQGATQAQSVPNLTVTKSSTLAVQNAAQAQTADNVTLSAAGALGIQNAQQAQTADSLVLTQVHNLQIQSASQAQSVPTVGVTKTSTLAIANASQTQAASNVGLTKSSDLVIDSAAQAQAVGNVGLTKQSTLDIQGATQAQSVGNVGITKSSELVVDGAAQAQSADSIVLGQIHELAIDNASQHQHADSADLFFAVPGEPVDGPLPTLAVIDKFTSKLLIDDTGISRVADVASDPTVAVVSMASTQAHITPVPQTRVSVDGGTTQAELSPSKTEATVGS